MLLESTHLSLTLRLFPRQFVKTNGKKYLPMRGRKMCTWLTCIMVSDLCPNLFANHGKYGDHLNELLEFRADRQVLILTPITAALIVGLSDVEMSQYAMRRNCLSLDCLQPSFCASHHLFIQD